MKVLCYNLTNTKNATPKQFDGYDVVVFGFDGLEKIRYKNELNGTESVLQNFASLSKTSKKIIVSGAITDNYGIVRRSAVIADNGKLLGISDMNLNVNSSGYSQGGGYRVYQTSKSRIGVIIGDDIIDYDAIKSMSLCDADFIIVIENEEKPQYELLIRAYSYLFGLPIILISSSNTLATDLSGEICGGSRDGVSDIILPTKKTYRVIQNKRRGVF
ncbi:MAG: hypothetical protein J6R88_03880 [Clostridia bacterium]|nr:hypothetical protein [Clostridia bacterium]